MSRAEWTNTLPNVGTGSIRLGAQRDLGVITDYFPISDGSYSVPPEGFYSVEGTWVEWHTWKHYPSHEAWKAEKEQERATEERKLIPWLFGLTLKRRREWYNNNIYRQLYTPEEREALALRDAGKETAEEIAKFEREHKQQYSKTE